MAEEQAAPEPAFKQLDCKVSYQPLDGPIEPKLHEIELKEPVVTEGLTVGQSFILDCQGESLSVNPKQFQIDWPKETKDFVKDFVFVNPVLVESGPASIKLQAKSYFAGNSNLNFYINGDEQSGTLEIKGLELKVESLKAFMPAKGYADPNAPEPDVSMMEGLKDVLGQQGAQPVSFPMIGKIKSSYPMALWIGVGIICLLVLTAIFALFKKSQSKKQLQARWLESKSPYGSHKDFHKTIRSLERKWYQGQLTKQEFAGEIYAKIKLFFFREYKIDDELAGHQEILSFFSKDKKSKVSRIKRMGILLEGVKDSTLNSELSEEELKDYLKRSRELIDHLYLKGGF